LFEQQNVNKKYMERLKTVHIHVCVEARLPADVPIKHLGLGLAGSKILNDFTVIENAEIKLSPEAALQMLRLTAESKTPRDGQWHDVPDTDGMQAIMGKDCEIVLERRPHYCDRGNFSAKIFPRGDFCREIDNADGFPRYYFDEERAKLEIEAWLAKRKQKM